MEQVVLPDLPNYYFQPNLVSLLSLLITLGLPVVAALFMKWHWPKQVQTLVLLVVVAVKVVLELWLNALNSGTHFDWQSAVYGTFINLLIALAAYYSLWKGTPTQQAALNGGVVKSNSVA